jgi:hypothetical protein
MRTSRKHFVRQLTQIERRQARLRRIRTRCKESRRSTGEEIATSPDVHHVIGQSQNHPVHIPTFLQDNADDPAIKASVVFYMF